MNEMLALTTCAVCISRSVSVEEVVFAAMDGKRPDRSGYARRAKWIFFSLLVLFSRAEVASPWDGVSSGAVLIPQAASRPRSWLATVLCKRPILVDTRSGGKMPRRFTRVDWAKSFVA